MEKRLEWDEQVFTGPVREQVRGPDRGRLSRERMLAGYAASKKVPAAAVMVRLTGLMILVGGVLVLIGWHRFIGAGLLAIFLFPTAFLMHNFRTIADPMAR